MERHVESAHRVIAYALARSRFPRHMCSFGKDSMVVLDLLAKHGVGTIYYLEDVDEIVDHDFIMEVQRHYTLDIVSLPKGRALFFVLGSAPLLVSFPSINESTAVAVPTNIDEYGGETEFMCVDDELRATHGTINPTPCDLVFLGQKLCDLAKHECRTYVDSLPPHRFDAYRRMIAEHGVYFEYAPGLPGCSPIKEWSDRDVWEYIERHGVPVSRKMYDGREKRPHKNPACYRCHDPDGSTQVECPKLGKRVMNLAAFTKPTTDTLKQLQRLGVLAPEDAEALEGAA